MNQIVLETRLNAFLRGELLWQQYRAVLTRRDDHWVIQVQQPIGEKWHNTPGQWYLATLLEHPGMDTASIDYGQRWEVTGMAAVLREALRHI